MASSDQLRALAEKVKIPGGKKLQQGVINKVQQNLAAPAATFTPTTRPLDSQAQASISQLLAAPAVNPAQEAIPTTIAPTDIATPTLTSKDLIAPSLQAPTTVNPRTVEPFTPSKLEQQARAAGNQQAIQSIRDSLSARGLNQSEAGTFIEQKLLIDRNRKFAQQDFERTRQLVQEELQKSTFEAQQAQQEFSNQLNLGQIDLQVQQANQQKNLQAQQNMFNNQLAVLDFNLQENNSLFTQQRSNQAFVAGREDQLVNQQIQAVQLASQQANFQFNKEQVKFALDLKAAGLPLQDGLQLMALIQRGDLAAADLVAKGLAIDAQTKSSLFKAIGSIGGKIIGGGLGFLATGGNPAGALIGASLF